jgi:hypothetical protein
MNDISGSEQQLVQPTEEQKNAAYQGPANSANRFVMTIVRNGVRLAFLEDDLAGTSHFRSAVLLNPEDAINMAQTILAMAQRAQAEAQAQMANRSRMKPTLSN